jgi:uncharacterized coiled-coil DUF342 family protein
MQQDVPREIVDDLRAERDALRAELAQERNERDTTADMLRQARVEVERVRAALKGVLAEDG